MNAHQAFLEDQTANELLVWWSWVELRVSLNPGSLLACGNLSDDGILMYSLLFHLSNESKREREREKTFLLMKKKKRIHKTTAGEIALSCSQIISSLDTQHVEWSSANWLADFKHYLAHLIFTTTPLPLSPQLDSGGLKNAHCSPYRPILKLHYRCVFTLSLI